VTISEFEFKRCTRALDQFLLAKRPAAQLRYKFDIGYRISGQSVELFELRADPREPSQRLESGLAKAVFVKKDQLWKIYWSRADMKWARYDPHPTVRQLSDFLQLVIEDVHGCFFA